MWSWYIILAAAVVVIAVVLKVVAFLKARSVRLAVAAYEPPATTVLRGKRVAVLVNPVGGNRLAMRICSDVVSPLLEKSGCEFTVVKTKHENHASDLGREWATSLLQGGSVPFDAVIVCSGDGMFCEHVNGFVSTILNTCTEAADDARRFIDQLVFAPVPCGSSNGLATSVLAAKPFDAMRRIIEAPTFGRPFDLTYLKFDDDKHKIVIDSHFINWGLVAEFDHACEHKLRWLGRDIKPLVAAAFVILRRKMRSGQIFFRPAKPSGKVPTTTPNGVAIPWSDMTDPSESVPVPDGVTGCPASEGWRMLTGQWLGVSICNTDWGADDALYAPGIGNNCGTAGLVITRAPGRIELTKSFLEMETGGHLLTKANSYFRVDKWRVVPDDVDHMDLSGRDVRVRPCSGETICGAMKLLG